jgi:hypothetical protein
MSSSDYNKIISTINSVSSNYSYSPDPNNLICIDSSNNRIGINTLNPTKAIDISGGSIRANDFIFMEPINDSVSLKELLTIKAPISNPSFTGIIHANNIEISGNIVPLHDVSSNLGSSLKRWRNAYIRDVSITNIDVSGNLNPLIANSSSLGSSSKYWSNAYIRDVSISNIDVSGNIVPLLDVSSNLGSSSKYWSNAYIRDVSVTNIDVSGNLNPLIANSSSLGSSSKRWGDAYIIKINGSIYNGTSDDRVKHNEVVIVNGLDVIDKLCPKFYQKTIDLLDANYYGDLSGHTWNYESGLIAQELLQISDLSFVVSGGDYYDSNNNLIKQTYGVNYNSVFVYGLAAIKELHAKVKAQETTILSLQTTILSLQTAMLEQQTLINNIILAQGQNN